MEYDPQEDWRPSSWLFAFASELQHDYLKHWELQDAGKESRFDAEDRAAHARLHEFAEALLPCLHSLAVSPDSLSRVRALFDDPVISSQAVADIAKVIHGHPIIRDAIRLDLALQAADTLLHGAEERAAHLVELIAGRQLSHRAAAFLDRATRLYLWGFEPECVVMCAAAMEAAYESRFTKFDMIRLQIPKTEINYTVADFERAALASKTFSPKERSMAAALRSARNDTVHLAPDSGMRAKEALACAALLLDRLFPVGQ